MTSTNHSHNSNQPASSAAAKKRKIVFIHLDLGIGGAEKLIVNLATASSSSHHNNDVSIYTSHCNPNHCFDAVKPPHGPLSSHVHVCGAFLPANVFGMGTAFCSTLRMMYCTLKAIADATSSDKEDVVFVLDVLPNSIPLIRYWFPSCAVLFYCHFPDKLLTRDNTTNGGGGNGVFRGWYRSVLNGIEERTMQYADLIAVNSNFTKREVRLAFPNLKLASENNANNNEIDGGVEMKVLYPAIDLTKFIPPSDDQTTTSNSNKNTAIMGPIVSLNRFERKKNISLLLHAYSLLLQRSSNTSTIIPKLVIAGGYDHNNNENISYLSELRHLSLTLNLTTSNQYESDAQIIFLPNISESQKSTLLKSALCVCYTPDREHFGIVPLEAMYAGAPIICVNSGGPMETVIHDSTGFLVENTPMGFADKIYLLMNDCKKRVLMGRNGHEHVKRMFGWEMFEHDWMCLVEECADRGNKRYNITRNGLVRVGYGSILYDLALAFIMAIGLTWFLRWIGVLDMDSNVWREVKWFVKNKFGDEF